MSMKDIEIYNPNGKSIEIAELEKLMEEMANAPREPYIRQPGEKCKYEQYTED